jgi:outer membrane protein assembly factor BamB
VIGTGFGVDERVVLSFDGSVLRHASTDADGSFAQRIRVPAPALPGGHTVTAEGESSGRSASAPFTVRTDWRNFRFDVANTGFNPYENVLNPTNVGDLTVLWSGPSAGAYSHTTSPVVAKGVVYVPVWGWFRTYGLDARTGAVRLRADVDGYPGTSATVAGGIAYIPTGDESQRAWLDAVDVSDGHVLWKAGDNFGGYASPATVVGSTVFDELACLCAFDAMTGHLKWSADAYGLGAPAYRGGVLYDTGIDGRVIAADAVTGDVRWTHYFGSSGWTQAAAAIADGLLFMGSSGDGAVRALDTSSGDLRWEFGTGGAIWGGPAVANGVVYIGSDDGRLYALDALSGDELWSSTIGLLELSYPAVANGVVYASTREGLLYALDASSGAVLWSYRVAPSRDSNFASPIVADGRLYYVGSTIYAFGLPG